MISNFFNVNINFLTKILNTPLYKKITVLHIIYIVLAFIITVFISKFLSLYVKRKFKDKIDSFKLEVLSKTISSFLYIIFIFFSLNILGINIGSLFVAGSIIGVIVGFATQKVGSNLVSGLFLFLERPFKIGNIVSINDVVGIVEDINAFSTVIRNFEGNFIRIPNEAVFTSTISSFNINPVRRIDYTVGIRYADDAQKAKEIILALLEENPFVVVNPTPIIFVQELADSSVNLKILFWAPSVKWFEVKTQMLWTIKVELENNGIQIPFPQSEIWFNNNLIVEEKKKS